MLEPAFWKIPSDLSASKKESKILRAQHYRFHIPHYLKDGTRIVPNIDSVFAILLAFDQFGSDIPVVLCEGSYYIPTIPLP